MLWSLFSQGYHLINSLLPSAPPSCTPARFARAWCLPSCPLGLKSETAFSWWFENGACSQFTVLYVIYHQRWSVLMERIIQPDPKTVVCLNQQPHHELPVLLVNKPTYPESTGLYFPFYSYMFAGHSIVL